MGEAEDIIFEQQRQAQEADRQAKERMGQELGRQLCELIPQAVASLKRNKYSYSGCHFMMVWVEGEERAAWLITPIDTSYIYLLADGKLVTGSGHILTYEEAGRSLATGFGADRVINVTFAMLRRIIDFTP